MVSQLALGLPQDVSISGIGGIENSHDALEFMLLGIVDGSDLHRRDVARREDDRRVEGRRREVHGRQGLQLGSGDRRQESPYFSTHMDLVQKMKAAKRSKAGEASRDNEWARKTLPRRPRS
jgi:hypothetical protein